MAVQVDSFKSVLNVPWVFAISARNYNMIKCFQRLLQFQLAPLHPGYSPLMIAADGRAVGRLKRCTPRCERLQQRNSN